jgi:hypothetical protein
VALFLTGLHLFITVDDRFTLPALPLALLFHSRPHPALRAWIKLSQRERRLPRSEAPSPSGRGVG